MKLRVLTRAPGAFRLAWCGAALGAVAGPEAGGGAASGRAWGRGGGGGWGALPSSRAAPPGRGVALGGPPLLRRGTRSRIGSRLRGPSPGGVPSFGRWGINREEASRVGQRSRGYATRKSKR
ncbi:hypothetical protein AVEN_170879-1 [Araneus ventricosus]|uniref:Uncharacterized protein n=1 Tax=Araneus ventricosus TaxID=182803 RepID=A0A4Y2T2N7_ARAVE|nr:hypothetical protein AVEN_170879-1 [Araneus ventricosus]